DTPAKIKKSAALVLGLGTSGPCGVEYQVKFQAARPCRLAYSSKVARSWSSFRRSWGNSVSGSMVAASAGASSRRWVWVNTSAARSPSAGGLVAVGVRDAFDQAVGAQPPQV